MVGIKVKHIVFGLGTITSFDGKCILVEFAAGEKICIPYCIWKVY